MTDYKESKLMSYLIEQCKNPTGIVGKTMIAIWNRTFPGMALWGLSHVSFEETDTILEIDFGGGMIINHLAKEGMGKKIYGLDISHQALQRAQKRNRIYIQQNQVVLQQGTAQHLPFPDQIFNKVLAIQTHMYWDEFAAAVAKIFASLKTGGTFVIICEKDKIAYHLPAYVEQSAMLQLLEQTGYGEAQVFETPKWIHYQALK